MQKPSVDDCQKQSDVGGLWRCQSQGVKPIAMCEAQAVIAAKGAPVFVRSKGLADEAMKGNVRLTLILPVDTKKDEGKSLTEPENRI